MYLKVEIRDKQYTISGTSEKYQKQGLAISTLTRIEEILRTGLSGSVTSKQLKEAAHKIRDRYLEKTSHLSWLRHFFGNVSKQERLVIDACKRIDRLAQPLPSDLWRSIARFLPVSDVTNMALTQRDTQTPAFGALVDRARKYGYTGRDLKEAQAYLQNIFTKVRILAESYLEKGEIAYDRKGQIDVEATLVWLELVAAQSLSKALLDFASQGDVAWVRFLLQHGADVHAKTSGGETALHKAIGSNQPEENILEIATMLLDAGASVSTTRFSPLHYAAFQGRPNVVSLLLARGADIKNVNSNGFTALESALHNRKVPESQVVKTVRILCEAGMDPNQAKQDEDPPLHWAARHKWAEVVALLLQYKADPNVLVPGNYTALGCALQESGRSAETSLIVRALLGAGANPNLASPGNPRPLEQAVLKQSYDDIINLVDFGARIQD